VPIAFGVVERLIEVRN